MIMTHRYFIIGDIWACFTNFCQWGWYTLWEQNKSFPNFYAQETLSVKEKRRLPTLPRVCSTIGAGGLNCSVRNGKRWDPATIATLMTIMTNHNNKHEHKRFMKRQETTCQILRRKNSARGNLFGQLVVLGCDVTVYTPAPYQRHRLWRPSKEI